VDEDAEARCCACVLTSGTPTGHLECSCSTSVCASRPVDCGLSSVAAFVFVSVAGVPSMCACAGVCPCVGVCHVELGRRQE
jgi:hypothetical protein